MIRSHGMVENGLHWVLDMIFRDDECRVRTQNAPFNVHILKHIALNVLRTGKTRTPSACAEKSPHGTKTPSQPHRSINLQSIPLGPCRPGATAAPYTRAF